MFEGIMRIRTHFFIIAMREEISRMRGCNEEVAVEHLMQLSPYEMKSLVGQILAAHETSSCPEVTPALSSVARWRHIQVQVQTSESTALKLSNIGANLPTELIITVQSAGYIAGNLTKIEVTRDGNTQPVRGIFGVGMTLGRRLP